MATHCSRRAVIACAPVPSATGGRGPHCCWWGVQFGGAALVASSWVIPLGRRGVVRPLCRSPASAAEVFAPVERGLLGLPQLRQLGVQHPSLPFGYFLSC